MLNLIRSLASGSMHRTMLVVSLVLAGCTTYVPVAPTVSRLSAEQLAAISRTSPLSAEQQQRLAEQNQQVLKEQDEADARVAEAMRQQQARAYAVEPWYGYQSQSYPGYYSPYPVYPAGWAPFYPGLSISLGYVWGRSTGAQRAWRGHR